MTTDPHAPSSSPLLALSPLDGRYHRQVKPLIAYYSEQALIRYRLRVEVEYFIALTEIPLPQLQSIGWNSSHYKALRGLYEGFDGPSAERVKTIEQKTNHDVKAVEYFLKEKMEELGLGSVKEFIHFGLTSQDINNTAIPLLFKESLEAVIFPVMGQLVTQIEFLASKWKAVSMLAYTHGQVASPTRLGKEMAVFSERLAQQLVLFNAIPHAGKFGGATGNFNAHRVAYPSINWPEFARAFLSHRLGLVRSSPTTQIEHYDHLAAQLDTLKRLNTILIDFSRDIWQYISLHYFSQKILAHEVGSSAMPHKVNPIDFENAEGNLGIANAIFEHLSAKLPISRLQRDLTDSTVLRNLGVPLGHTLLAYTSLLKGLEKLVLNQEKIDQDLESNWVVVSEAIQTILRRENYPEPYEALKVLTRGQHHIDRQAIHHFIEQLPIADALKHELHQITPFNYTGL